MKTPKYNCPIGMYSDTTMDEMVSGTSGLEWVLSSLLLNTCFYLFIFLSESKLDPEGPAYQKMKNSKKFDPKRSSVLMVLNAQVKQDQYQIKSNHRWHDWIEWSRFIFYTVRFSYLLHCLSFLKFANMTSIFNQSKFGLRYSSERPS